MSLFVYSDATRIKRLLTIVMDVSTVNFQMGEIIHSIFQGHFIYLCCYYYSK